MIYVHTLLITNMHGGVLSNDHSFIGLWRARCGVVSARSDAARARTHGKRALHLITGLCHEYAKQNSVLGFVHLFPNFEDILANPRCESIQRDEKFHTKFDVLCTFL